MAQITAKELTVGQAFSYEGWDYTATAVNLNFVEQTVGVLTDRSVYQMDFYFDSPVDVADQQVRVGSVVRFPGNGVTGNVFGVHTTYNTNEVTVEWSDGENSCHHLLSQLQVVTF